MPAADMDAGSGTFKREGRRQEADQRVANQLLGSLVDNDGSSPGQRGHIGARGADASRNHLAGVVTTSSRGMNPRFDDTKSLQGFHGQMVPLKPCLPRPVQPDRRP